ncbi:MAG TPA: acetate/propionate family kinase [Verrucomicrobiae bacterium]|jgi:acetate kinase
MTERRDEQLILALNAGSSSLKFALFRSGEALSRITSGSIDRIGLPDAKFTLRPASGKPTVQRPVSAPNHASCVGLLLQETKRASDGAGFAAVGHRVVHGGSRYTAPQIVTPEMVAELRRISPLSPEHLPAEIDLIEAFGKTFPYLAQVACFDTAFHRDLPPVARLLAIPRRYEAAGVRRYGFHGLSYEFLMEELARLGDPACRRGRVILAHLGNGASLAAVRDGRCIDTSMGFTPAAGLVMGRRPGDIDPGLVAYLARTEGMSAEQFHELVNHQSGLLGVSETSSDMRELLAAETHDPRAAEAVALFCYQAKKWMGAFAAALGGLDTLVFSGGIGENNALIRARIGAGLDFLGVKLDETRNAAHAALISADKSRVQVRVIRTDEELMIARSARRILEQSASKKG